jgi:hypothetical protein
VTLLNFLLIDAGKSGTTSLYYYLEQHPEEQQPEVYMSLIKGPLGSTGERNGLRQCSSRRVVA